MISRLPSAANAMARLILPLVEGEGFVDSALADVKLLHSTRNLRRSPIIYEPCVVFIAQGKKIAWLGERPIMNDSGHYLSVTAPLPFASETQSSANAPLLGVAIRLVPAVVMELMLQIEGLPIQAESQIIESCPMDERIAGSVLRLLECLQSPNDARVLGPSLIREVIYRLLCSDQGGSLRGLASPSQRGGQIARIVHRLHRDYASAYDMDSLAREAGMSLSAFHAHFKALTAVSPLQYLKAIRLQQARLLMVNEKLSAIDAANRVGYESASQFSREFKRFFGETPTTVAQRLRRVLSDVGVPRMRGGLTFG